MKLTLNSSAFTPKYHITPLQPRKFAPAQQRYEEQGEKSVCTDCNLFSFSDYQYNSPNANKDCAKQRERLLKGYQPVRQPILDQQKLVRKHKICLSLKHSAQTQAVPIQAISQQRRYSQSKIGKALQQQQNSVKSQLQLLRAINFCNKVKTQPMLQSSIIKDKLDKLKESPKQETNVMTPATGSLKQSKISTSKKIKLSLSNDFKSSMAKVDSQQDSKPQAEILQKKNIEGTLTNHQFFIQQSFFTAKLHNIYEQISSSFMNQSYSNMLQHNQAVTNQQSWKRSQTLSYSQLNPEGTQMQTKEENLNQNSRIQQKNTNILQDIQSQPESQHQKVEQKKGIRGKFFQRKYIGQYARTIKSFDSELKDEYQSIVLQHYTFEQHAPSYTINRGSIKDEPRFPHSSEIRRYGSFGQKQYESNQTQRDFFQYVTNPIQQNSYDSEKQN